MLYTSEKQFRSCHLYNWENWAKWLLLSSEALNNILQPLNDFTTIK